MLLNVTFSGLKMKNGKVVLTNGGSIFYKIKYENFCSYLARVGKTFELSDNEDMYDYISELRASGTYDVLLIQTVKEVFHILFQNRKLMLVFNEMIACEIATTEINGKICEQYSVLFAKSGMLKRQPIPQWVKDAVFFRDKERCVLCDKDLSGTINRNNVENYDHIVPLARGGLNDITNIQLLCKECNQNEKRDGVAVTSEVYQNWYQYD